MRTLPIPLIFFTMMPVQAMGGAEDRASPSAKDAIRKGIAFLTADAKRWMEKRDCVSCHHPTLGIWALNEAKRRGHPIDEKALTEMTSWALTTYKKRNPNAGPETRAGYWNSTLEGTYLAFVLGSGPLPRPEHREALEHLLKRLLAMQEPDGSWNPFAYWPPLIDKQYFNTTWTFLALSQHQVSEKTNQALTAGRAKALKWLEAIPSEDHHQALIARLLLWKRLGKPVQDAEPLLRQLTASQNPDGGWSQTPKMGSDALATGQTLYALGLAGKTDPHPPLAKGRQGEVAVQKAQEFLRRTQRPDGSWPMTSRPPARGKPTDNLMPIVYAATAWATLGLLAASAADAVPPAAENDSPKPLPKALALAWKEAGAEVCWLRVDKPGVTSDAGFGSLMVVAEKDGKPGDLPAFNVTRWQEGRLTKLPVPAAPFGLYLANTQVTDAGLKELAGLKTLQTLSLFGTKVTDAGLKELARLESLQALYLGRTQVTDAGLKELARLKSLQTLNLGVTKVTDAGLKELAGLKSLQALNLDFAKVTDAGLEELAGLKGLHTLNLNSTQVSDAGLKALAKLKSLQALDLGGTRVTDAGLMELARLESLQALVLPRTKVTDAGLKRLAPLKSLQMLNLRATKVTDTGLKELAGLTSLQTLNISYTKVTDMGLKELAGLTSLQALNLKLTHVTDAGLKELAKLTSLRRLDLNSTKVTDAGPKELQTALPGCKITR